MRLHELKSPIADITTRLRQNKIDDKRLSAKRQGNRKLKRREQERRERERDRAQKEAERQRREVERDHQRRQAERRFECSQRRTLAGESIVLLRR